MDQALVPLLSGLVGAFIGAASSVATIIVQSHYQSRREFRRMAFDAAIADLTVASDIAKANKSAAWVAPLTAYLYFHVRYLELLDKGKLTPESLQRLKQNRDELFGKPK